MKIKTRKVFISVCAVMLVFVSALMVLFTPAIAQATSPIVIEDNILTITGETADKPIWKSKDANNTNLTITEDLGSNAVTIAMNAPESKATNERFTYNAVMAGYGAVGNARYGVKADGSTIGFKLDTADLHIWSEYFISFGSYVERGVSLVGVAINRADGNSTHARYVLGVDGAPAGNWLAESGLIQLKTFHWGLDSKEENLLTTKVVDGFPQFAINGQDITLSDAGFITVAKERYAALSNGVGFVTIGAKYDNVKEITTPAPSKFTTTITKVHEKNSDIPSDVYVQDISSDWVCTDATFATATNGIVLSSAAKGGAIMSGNNKDTLIDGLNIRFKVDKSGMLDPDLWNKEFSLFFTGGGSWYNDVSYPAFGIKFTPMENGCNAAASVLYKDVSQSDFAKSPFSNAIPFSWNGDRQNSLEISLENSKLNVLVNGVNIEKTENAAALAYTYTNIISKLNNKRAFVGFENINGDCRLAINSITIKKTLSTATISVEKKSTGTTALDDKVEVSGNGIYNKNGTATICAKLKQGNSFMFAGWYKNNILVSENQEYTFVVSENSTYVAHFSHVSELINVYTDTNIKASIAHRTVSSAESLYGYAIEFTAPTVVGNTFDGWYLNGKLLSANSSYTLPITSNIIKMKAKYKPANTTKVVFESSAGIFTDIQFVAKEDDIKLPAVPLKHGYTAGVWEKTQEAGYIKYVAKYTKSTNEYAVTIQGGSPVLYKVNSLATVSATKVAGQKFAYWTENETIVSYDETYSFVVFGDRTLVPVFTETAITIQPLVIIDNNKIVDTTNDSKNIVQINASTKLPQGYQFVERGFIGKYKTADNALTLATAGIGQIKSTIFNQGEFYGTFTLKDKTQNFIARAYLIYKDANNNTHIMYSNILEYTLVK